MELVRENIKEYNINYNLKFQKYPVKPSQWVNWRLNKNNEIRNEIYKLKHYREFNLQTTLCKIKL